MVSRSVFRRFVTNPKKPFFSIYIPNLTFLGPIDARTIGGPINVDKKVW